MTTLSYDVIVVGAGHAGCEAALAAAHLGSETLLITMDLTKCAQMSCNPAIGGIAKGQIVREIDALGGGIGLITDRSTIQFRMLNRSKGPAMWSPRAQCDRMLFSASWRHLLENTPHLGLWQDEVQKLVFEGQRLCGVETRLGARFAAKAVVITAGTFLNGLIHLGLTQIPAGRIGEPASVGLSRQLGELGLRADRMKTGTPPRIDARSLSLPALACQPGDENPRRFSYLPIPSAIQKSGCQRACYMVYTNREVHDILRTGFEYSPLFTGRIHGKGPRYCPSIEDKLRTFADKDQHPLFLEPEGWNTQEYYLQGFSSSLPLDVQLRALCAIKGLEKVRIFRPAYAIEYDYFIPTQLSHSLEVKNIENLFFAGQVNGTTGYEEAAAQGFMAGVNAHLKIRGKDPFVLHRDEAYIGVLIDDLVTKGVDEPYRMFTSRAEYRILLRQDNADERLTALGHALGTVSDRRLQVLQGKLKVREEVLSFIHTQSLTPEQINPLLVSSGSTPIVQKHRFDDILGRPQISWAHLQTFVPHETFRGWTEALESAEALYSDSAVCEGEPLDKAVTRVLEGVTDIPAHPQAPGPTDRAGTEAAQPFPPVSLMQEVFESAEILVKYKGYIERENLMARKLHRLESVPIPQNFRFSSLLSLSTESRQKLERIHPRTIGQASRIPGVSPADIAILLLYIGR